MDEKKGRYIKLSMSSQINKPFTGYNILARRASNLFYKLLIHNISCTLTGNHENKKDYPQWLLLFYYNDLKTKGTNPNFLSAFNPFQNNKQVRG